MVVGPPNVVTDLGGGIFEIDPVTNSATPLANQPAELRRATKLIADPRSNTGWYVGTRGTVVTSPGPVYIYHVSAAAGRVLTARKLNTDDMTSDVEIKAMVLVDDKVIFGSDTRVGYVPAAGGASVTLFTFARANLNPAIASDGRYLYTNIWDNNGWSTGGGSIWRHDLQNLGTATSIFSVDNFPTNIYGLTLDASGRLWSVSRGTFAAPVLRAFDVFTGTKINEVVLPWTALTSAMSVAVDGVNDNVVVTGQGFASLTDKNFYAAAVQNWKVGTPINSSAHELTGSASRRVPGLVRRGFECKSPSNPELAALASGTPEVGNNKYSVDLRGPSGRVAVFLLGAGAAFPPVKLLPTACELGVNPILVFGAVIPPSQRLQIPLPIPANAVNAFVDTQWAVFEASANALGIVTTQVGAIFVR